MRRFRALPYVLAAVLLAACGSDGVTTPEEKKAPTGTFTLQSVNGKSLPYSFTTAEDGPGVVFTINSDFIKLELDGKFGETTTVSVTESGQTIGPATLVVSGTFVYTAATNAITLSASGGGQISGTVVSDAMTLKDGSDTYVYRIQ